MLINIEILEFSISISNIVYPYIGVLNWDFLSSITESNYLEKIDQT